MKIQPPQVSTLTSLSRVRSSCQRAFPVLLVENVGGLAFQVERPGMIGAAEFLPFCRRRDWRPVGRANEPAAAMRAHIVVRLDRVGRSADDQDRVIADVVGDEAADLGNFFDAADVLPHLGPQLIALGLGILPRNIGFHR